MHKHIRNITLAASGAFILLGSCAAQALLTIEGVTLGQSKDEALASGFKIERFEGAEYLLKDVPSKNDLPKSVILRSAKSGNSTSERIVSITVNQLFKYNEPGMEACKRTAMRLSRESREALGRSAEELKPRIFGSALPSHLATVYATRFGVGKLEVDSTCVATSVDNTPIYNQYFSAALW